MARLRVISGEKKGRCFRVPSDKDIRPSKDFVREAIFNIIYNRPKNAQVLDLFAGSGSYGIEALSRGAKVAIFVDIDHKTIINENCLSLGFSNFKIYKSDVRTFLKKSKGDFKFDLIFLDPPYEYEFTEEIIITILKNDFLAINGLMIIETGLKNDFPFIRKFVNLEKIYGISKILFIKKGEDNEIA